MKYDAIIVASGKGERANLGYNKVFHVMKDGKTVLDHSVSLFLEDKDCSKIIVVTNGEDFDSVSDNEKLVKVEGGQLRKDSVYNGLKLAESEYVFIHDGARPFLKKENLEELKKKVVEKKAVVLGHMSSDTVKKVEGDRIVETLDRKCIFLAETPQVFETKILKDAYERCGDTPFTDDGSLVEAAGYEVYIVDNGFSNTKLTTPDDFENI